MDSSQIDSSRESLQSTGVVYAEDIKLGDVWTTDPREVTADDVADFAVLTGDHDPLHAGDASASPFGEPVAHGLLGLSVMAGLSSECPNTATLALVSVNDWQFLAPIFFGDHVHVRTEVESIEPHGRRAAKIIWFRKLINQDGRVVQQGRLTTLVATRERATLAPAGKKKTSRSPKRAK